jgi:hypothetical protein
MIGGVGDMTDPDDVASGDVTANRIDDLAPTQAEIDAWAAREKARREAWLRGPTDEERAEFAREIRQRRLAETFDVGEQRIEEGVRQGLRVGRETQLALEGAMLMAYRWSRRTFGDLVRAGRTWEEETALPIRRRRIPIDEAPKTELPGRDQP